MKDTKIRCRNAKETEKLLKVIEERHPEVKWQSGSKPTKFNPFAGCDEDDGGYLAIRCDRITFANNDEVRDGDFADATSVKRFMRRHNTTIHIHQKGNMVIAHESQTGREGIAKCSPEDKFDFYTGAKLALARLYGDEFIPFEEKKPEVTIAEGHCSYKVGDKVVVKSWKSLEDKYGLDSLGFIKDIAFVGGMQKYCGKVGIVNEVCGNYVHLDIYGSDTGYGFHKDSIEPWDSTIREGDIVRIVDSGCIYTTNIPWLKENVTDTDLIARYQYGTSPENSCGKYKVIKIAKHLMWDDELAYIQSVGFEGKCYIIGVTGLDKTDEP